MYKNFIIPYLYDAQHVSGNTPPIIRSLKLHWQPLVFHMRKVVGCADGRLCQAHCAWQSLPSARLTTFHVWKTRGCQCTFRLLEMGGVSPETCWASYRYGIIKFWYIVASCWFFFMNCTVMHSSTNIKFIITPSKFQHTLCAKLFPNRTESAENISRHLCVPFSNVRSPPYLLHETPTHVGSFITRNL